MVQGTSSAFIGTTYPSEEEDIYDAEAGYKELEEALDEQICSMEAAHPGYDEYRCQVDEIAHNPYQLISFLTVLYEEFTYGQIKDNKPFPDIFLLPVSYGQTAHPIRLPPEFHNRPHQCFPLRSSTALRWGNLQKYVQGQKPRR